MSEWIKVEERLPDNSNNVLVSDTYAIKECYLWEGTWLLSEDGTVVNMKPTHWMSLELPKGEY